MRQRSGLRLVPPESGPSAEWADADERSPSEPRLRILTVGEKTFGEEWRGALASRAESVVALGSLEYLLDKLSADHTQLGLVGIAAHQEAETLASIAAASDWVRRRVLLVSPTIAGELARRVLSAGVRDFVTTSTPAAAVIVRLELRILDSYAGALRGSDEMEGGMALLMSVQSNGDEASDEAPRVTLTGREERLYALFAQRFGYAISREEILRDVWQRPADGGSRSNIVDVYVRYLRVKLESAAPHLEIVTVRDVGYRMCERRGSGSGGESGKSAR